MATQIASLHELANMLRSGLRSAEAMQKRVSYTRCAAYPDPERFIEERADIERKWPAFVEDLKLSRVPRFFSGRGQTRPPATGTRTIITDCKIACRG